MQVISNDRKHHGSMRTSRHGGQRNVRLHLVSITGRWGQARVVAGPGVTSQGQQFDSKMRRRSRLAETEFFPNGTILLDQVWFATYFSRSGIFVWLD